MTKKTGRKKMNYMVNYEIIEIMKELVPEGKRSDFINEALGKELSILKRKIAFKEMDKLKKKHELKISDDEMTKLKNYGRE